MDNREREIERGFLCEVCLEPLEDSRPLVEDWRVPKGRIKRLCPTCAEKEDINGRAMDKLAPFQALSLTDWGVFEEALNIMAGVPKKKVEEQ